MRVYMRERVTRTYTHTATSRVCTLGREVVVAVVEEDDFIQNRTRARRDPEQDGTNMLSCGEQSQG